MNDICEWRKAMNEAKKELDKAIANSNKKSVGKCFRLITKDVTIFILVVQTIFSDSGIEGWKLTVGKYGMSLMKELIFEELDQYQEVYIDEMQAYFNGTARTLFQDMKIESEKK